MPVTDQPLPGDPSATLLALPIEDLTFGWPTETIVRAAWAGSRIIEVPVACRPRNGGRSKVSGTLRGAALAAVRILGAIPQARAGRRDSRRPATRGPSHRRAQLP